MSRPGWPGRERPWARTPALERTLNHLATVLVAGTGVAVAILKYLLEAAPDDPFAIPGHPWQGPALAAHVLVAPLGVLALGMLLARHVLPRLLDARSTRSRRSGVLLSATALPMIASGGLLQVTASEGWLRAWLVVHLVTGGAWGVGWVLHLLSARRRART